MATLLEEGLEGGTNGATITTSNTTFSTVSNAPLFTNDSMFGSLAMDLATGAVGNRYGDCVFSTKTAIWTRFYVKLVSTTAQAYLVNCTSTLANLRVETTGALRARNATTAVGVVSTSVLSASTWTRVEYRLDFTAGQQQFRMFTGANVNGTTPDYDSGNLTLTTGAGITSIGFGSLTSVTGASYHMDQIAVSDSAWLGPYTANATVVGASVPSIAVTALSGAVSAGGGTGVTVSGPATSVTATAKAGTVFTNIAPDHIAVIGDSLTYMRGNGETLITDELDNVGWDASKVHVSGVTGRLIYGGSTHPTTTETIADWRSSSIDAGTWISALGANNQGSTPNTVPRGYFLSHWAEIGPNRVLHVIDQGFQGQSENTWSYNGAGTLGARYTATSLSEINAAIRNAADLANADPTTYPTVVVHNWNDLVSMRAAGSSIWDLTDTSSVGGTARHMTDPGYSGYRAPFYAAIAPFVGGVAVTGNTPPVVTVTALAGAVSTTRNPTVAGPVTSVTATALAGTVSAIRNVTLVGPAPSSTATALAGTVTVTANPTAAGPSTSVTVSAVAGTVITGGSVAVSGQVTTVTSTALAGTVTTTRHPTVAGTVTTITASALAGSITATSGMTVAGPVCATTALALAGAVTTTRSAVVDGAVAGVAAMAWPGSVAAVNSAAITPESRIYAIAAEVRVYQLTRERRVLEVPS